MKHLILSSLLFLYVMGSWVPASSHEEAGFADKYVTKAYFDGHGSLIDSQFDKFMETKIQNDICEVLENRSCIAAMIHRDLIGEGSHRSLSSSIKLKLNPSFRFLISSQTFEFITIERLPLGVFADPFELQHRAYTDAAVFGDTNLELPYFLSNRSVVEVHMNFSSESLSTYQYDLDVSFDIPLHARYPPLGQYFSKVVFRQPDLLICCCGNGDADEQRKKCAFIPSEGNSDPLIWEIPCGIKEHASFVSAFTFIFAIVAALVIVVTSSLYPDKKLKRS